jgi:hypothetical protein
MRPDEIRALLKQQPFVPFRVFVHESTSFLVIHPEFAILGPSTLTLYEPNPDDTGNLGRRRIIIALLHIIRLEQDIPPLQPTASPANGEGSDA